MKSFSESFAKWRGGYGFIISLAVFLVIWILLNELPWWAHFDDPHLFLLNLILSIEASFAMPVLLMSQTRQSKESQSLINEDLAADRQHAELDYQINLESKTEIEELTTKLGRIEVEKLDKIYNQLIKLNVMLDKISMEN